jgi:hypothetical protein
MHPREADLTKTDGHYGKARLKEVLNRPPMYQLWTTCDRVVMICAQWL